MSYSKKQSDLKAAREEKLAASIRVSALVRVLSFDPEAMTVSVQPLVKAKIDQKYASQPPLAGVPIACMCFGDYTIRPWYQPGDIGIVVFGDTDADAALMSGGEAEPSTPRMHAPEDGVFIGGICAGGKRVEGLPPETLAVAAGNTVFAVGKDKITILGDIEMYGRFMLGGVVLNWHTHTCPEGETSGPH